MNEFLAPFILALCDLQHQPLSLSAIRRIRDTSQLDSFIWRGVIWQDSRRDPTHNECGIVGTGGGGILMTHTTTVVREGERQKGSKGKEKLVELYRKFQGIAYYFYTIIGPLESYYAVVSFFKIFDSRKPSIIVCTEERNMPLDPYYAADCGQWRAERHKDSDVRKFQTALINSA